ncbi:hypothetical protein GQ53DRAFT_770551 [Thozetella sp. PMI_491]|nr:hypothetical protein GQ53DRAFT_770551 [Thozetella sp. PMI_491]
MAWCLTPSVARSVGWLALGPARPLSAGGAREGPDARRGRKDEMERLGAWPGPRVTLAASHRGWPVGCWSQLTGADAPHAEAGRYLLHQGGPKGGCRRGVVRQCLEPKRAARGFMLGWRWCGVPVVYDDTRGLSGLGASVLAPYFIVLQTLVRTVAGGSGDLVRSLRAQTGRVPMDASPWASQAGLTEPTPGDAAPTALTAWSGGLCAKPLRVTGPNWTKGTREEASREGPTAARRQRPSWSLSFAEPQARCFAAIQAQQSDPKAWDRGVVAEGGGQAWA